MEATKEMKLQWEYENEILELIDNQDEYTRSDLQGRVTAIVMNILRKEKELGTDTTKENKRIGEYLTNMLKSFCTNQLTHTGRNSYEGILEMFVKYVKSGGKDITIK